jgi:hypothetical protein
VKRTSVFLLFLSFAVAVQAAPTASTIQSRLTAATANLNAEASRVATARGAGFQLLNTQAAAAARSIGSCNAPLAGSDGLDKRIAWAELVVACLEQVEAGVVAARYTADAQDQQSISMALTAVTDARVQTAEYLAELGGEKDFLGAKWGIGVGYSHAFRDVVDDAGIVDGLVRVKKDLTGQPRVIFEFHNFIGCNDERVGDVPVKTGCGFFAAVASRDDKAVSGVAAGFMYGWKTGTGTEAKALSIGIGLIADGSGKKLGAGYKEGEPPPPGSSTVFLKDKSVVSAIIFLTRTF